MNYNTLNYPIDSPHPSPISPPEPMDISPQRENPYYGYSSQSSQSAQLYTPSEPNTLSTSYGHRYPDQPSFPPPQGMIFTPTEMASELLGNPALSSAAMQYGTKIGKEMVDKELSKYVAPSKLKYYFSVDTSYVLRKLKLLLFPFSHVDWSQKYEKNMPLPPRQDVNAPDLYIPAMAYITYVLIAGLVLGIQDRFTPEMLGIIASQALAWVVIEIILELISLYLMNIPTRLKTWDLVSFAGYKFVGIILSVILGLFFGRLGYFGGLSYLSLSLAFFLVRTMKWLMMVDNTNNLDNGYSRPATNIYFNTGNKRRLYFLLTISVLQPFLMWWLSYHLEPVA